MAREIGSALVGQEGRWARTYDGHAHGAFSNALLETVSVLPRSGEACGALFQSVKSGVQRQSRLMGVEPQTPVLLAPASAAAQKRPCFASVRPVARVSENPPIIAIPPTPGPDASLDSRVSPIWQELYRIAGAGGQSLNCRASQPSYREKERTVLTCEAPSEGYVTVFSYGEGDGEAVLLLPNRYGRSAQVRRGTFRIPGDGDRWAIENSLPEGQATQQQLMLVLFSSVPIDPKDLGVPAGIFRSLDDSETKALRSQSVTPLASYQAAIVVFPITK